jgi:hypothetical protein
MGIALVVAVNVKDHGARPWHPKNSGAVEFARVVLNRETVLRWRSDIFDQAREVESEDLLVRKTRYHNSGSSFFGSVAGDSCLRVHVRHAGRSGPDNFRG